MVGRHAAARATEYARSEGAWQVDEPVRRGLAELAGRLLGGVDLEALLVRHAEEARRLVPALVGLSMTVVHHGVVLTAATTHEDLLPLDDAQIRSGEGPCLTATSEGRPVGIPDVTDEKQWQAFAASAAAAGIASSLSLPVTTTGRIALGVNLYAGTRAAFRGHEEELLALFGSGSEPVVHNADLGHQTRGFATELPEAVADVHAVDRAVGVLVATERCSPERALLALHAASDELGYELVDMARRVVRSMAGPGEDAES